MKFFTDYVNIILLCALLISGWMLFVPKLLSKGKGTISSSDAIQLINRKNAIVIDLRQAEQFAKGHIPLAKNIHLNHLTEKVTSAAKKKQTPILLVCQRGIQAHKAKSMLEQLGYTEVNVLEGGMGAWKQANMPIVS